MRCCVELGKQEVPSAVRSHFPETVDSEWGGAQRDMNSGCRPFVVSYQLKGELVAKQKKPALKVVPPPKEKKSSARKEARKTAQEAREKANKELRSKGQPTAWMKAKARRKERRTAS